MSPSLRPRPRLRTWNPTKAKDNVDWSRGLSSTHTVHGVAWLPSNRACSILMVHSHCRMFDRAELDYGLLTLHATPQLYALQQSILYAI